MAIFFGERAGDGSGARAITGFGFKPTVLFCWAATFKVGPPAHHQFVGSRLKVDAQASGQGAMWGEKEPPGGVTRRGYTETLDGVSSLDVDGFTVTTNFNQVGDRIFFLGFDTIAGLVETGTYTGTDTGAPILPPRQVPGLTFEPHLFIAMPALSSGNGVNEGGVRWCTDQSQISDYIFTNRQGLIALRTTSSPAGAEVGVNLGAFNKSGEVYSWVAFRFTPGGANLWNRVLYSGDTSDSQAVAGLGFQPGFILGMGVGDLSGAEDIAWKPRTSSVLQSDESLSMRQANNALGPAELSTPNPGTTLHSVRSVDSDGATFGKSLVANLTASPYAMIGMLEGEDLLGGKNPDDFFCGSPPQVTAF